jgi:hypothetical protein
MARAKLCPNRYRNANHGAFVGPSHTRPTCGGTHLLRVSESRFSSSAERCARKFLRALCLAEVGSCVHQRSPATSARGRRRPGSTALRCLTRDETPSRLVGFALVGPLGTRVGLLHRGRQNRLGRHVRLVLFSHAWPVPGRVGEPGKRPSRGINDPGHPPAFGGGGLDLPVVLRGRRGQRGNAGTGRGPAYPARSDSRTRRRGLSSFRSTRQMRCQVPSRSRPRSTGTLSDGPMNTGSRWSAP